MKPIINYLVKIIFLIFFFTACAQQKIINKTSTDFSEKRVALSTLLEYPPYDYLRQEYAKNSKLTEDVINNLAQLVKRQQLSFADQGKDDARLVVVHAGEEVEVVGKVFMEPLGDFVKISTAQGMFLVRDDNPRFLVLKDEYDKMNLRNMDSPSITESKTPSEEIDYYNHINEEDRVRKIKWFCSKYPQYAKYENYTIKKQLTIGMPEHLLVLAWGRPNNVEEVGRKEGVFKVFKYSGNYYVSTKNGIIDSWKKQED